MPRPASPPSRIDGGYYRFPTIHQETVVFVSENDLWRVSLAGGAARRLTSSPGTVSRPRLSPDGKQLAFISQEEGQPEVYLAPAEGGPAERLTFFGAHTLMVGWTPDGKSVIFASNQGQPFERSMQLYEIPATGGHPQALPYGLARTISHGPKGRVVLGRHTDEIAHWKRYRGGRAGVLWVDAKGKGEFKPLIELPGNLANPMWIGKRIYFASDHEGVGNLYSCLPSGKGLQRHSDNDEYYLRNPSTDGSRIVYHAAAELYCYDPAADSHSRIEIDYHSPRVGRNRKFVSAARHLESYALHPSGDTTLMICRGKPYGMAHWEGAVRRYGEPQGVRYRHGQYLHGGEHLLLVSDQHEREEIEVHSVAPPYEVRRLEGLDLGRTVSLSVSPMNDHAAVTNHRNELLLVDVEAGTIKTVDRSDYGRIQGVAWSPDGRWLAYGIATTQETCSIKIYELSSEQTHQLTPPSFRDVAPEWDPEGKYLYFLSYRVFDPVYDNQFFELSFPRGMKPYLITLKAETASAENRCLWRGLRITASRSPFTEGVAHAPQAAPQSPLGPIRGAIHRDRKVRFGFLDDDIGQPVQTNSQIAALVYAALRSVDIRQAHDHAANAVLKLGQCEAQPMLHMPARAVGEFDAMRLNIDLHQSSTDPDPERVQNMGLIDHLKNQIIKCALIEKTCGLDNQSC